MQLQGKNPRYSLRSYSTKVGIHSSTLSYIMNGKRNVSRKLAEKITRKLLLDPQKRSEILELFPLKKRIRTEAAELKPRFLEIEASQFKMNSEWEHFAVLSLMNCQEFKNDTVWIAERLGITKDKAQQVIQRLIEVGIVRENDGVLIRDKSPYRTSDDTVNLSVRKGHDENLDLAKESLHRDSIHERDFTHLTVAIDMKKIPLAKEMIRRFQDELMEAMECGDQTEVYRFTTQLFPLTKLIKKDRNK